MCIHCCSSRSIIPDTRCYIWSVRLKTKDRYVYIRYTQAWDSILRVRVLRPEICRSVPRPRHKRYGTYLSRNHNRLRHAVAGSRYCTWVVLHHIESCWNQGHTRLGGGVPSWGLRERRQKSGGYMRRRAGRVQVQLQHRWRRRELGGLLLRSCVFSAGIASCSCCGLEPPNLQ